MSVIEEIGIWTHVDDDGNEIQLYPVTKQIIQTTDPVLEKSCAGGIKVNSVSGNCEQTQYTGKNLLENTKTTETINGVSFTVNEDGSVTVDGTATEETRFAFLADVVGALPSGTYTASGCPENGSWSTYQFQIWIKDTSVSYSDLGSGVSFGYDTSYMLRAQILIASGATLNNLTFYPMIRSADIVDDTYEPYVGGVASPNPDYPQEIKSAEVSEIKAVGKNLFNTNNLKATYNDSVEVSDEGYTIVAVGGSSRAYTSSVASIDNVESLLGKTVCLKVDSIVSTQSDVKVSFQLNVTNSNGTVYTGVHNTMSDLSVTASVPEDATKIEIGIYTNNTANVLTESNTVTVKGAMLTLLEDTEWEPYQESVVSLSEAVTLPGVPNYADTLDVKNAKIISNIGSASLIDHIDACRINEENTTYSEDILRFDFTSTFGCKTNTTILCDKFTYKFTHNANTQAAVRASECISSHSVSDTVSVFIDKSRLATADVAGFTTWLQENDVNIVYVLATPVESALPAADQIALHRLESFDTVTYISTDSDVEATVEVEYGTDKVGSYILKNINELSIQNLTLSAQIAAINAALPYTITIDDTAQTIDFTDR